MESLGKRVSVYSVRTFDSSDSSVTYYDDTTESLVSPTLKNLPLHINADLTTINKSIATLEQLLTDKNSGECAEAFIFLIKKINKLENNYSSENSAITNLCDKLVKLLSELNARKNFQSLNLAAQDLSGMEFSPRNLHHTVLDLSNTNFNRATLTESDLSETILRDATFVEASMQKINLSNADLTGAKMSKAKLNEATIISTVLLETDLSEANLTGANLQKTTLVYAIKDGVILDNVKNYVNIPVIYPDVTHHPRPDARDRRHRWRCTIF